MPENTMPSETCAKKREGKWNTLHRTFQDLIHGASRSAAEPVLVVGPGEKVGHACFFHDALGSILGGLARGHKLCGFVSTRSGCSKVTGE